MAKLLKPIDSINYTEEIVKSTLKTVSGDNLQFILSPKTGSTYSHLWMGPLFSLPVNDRMEEEFITPYVDGGLSGTALEYLVREVGDNVIIADIDKDSFESGIDGLNFKLDIPLDPAYSGTSFSGLSTTSLYGSYMKTELYDKKNTVGPCSCSVMDTLLSENSQKVTTEIDQGLAFQNGVNPQDSNSYYSSGLVYLFSDDVKKPNISASTVSTTNSWATGFGNECPYTVNRKFPFNLTTDLVNGYFYDQPVGVVDLLGGKVTIFNKDLVDGFNFSGATGGTSTTGATFPVSAASTNFISYDVEQGLDMTLIAGKNEFDTSTNPTYDPQACDGKIYITYVDFYDSQGRLVAKGVTETPLSKERDEILVLNANIKL
jgi:hypothetical protein